MASARCDGEAETEDVTSEMRSASVVYGVLKLAVDAAQRFPDDAALQAQCALALARACVNDDARGSVMFVGGLGAVCAGMQRHAGDAKVAASGCQAIGRMGEDFSEEDLLGDVVDIDLEKFFDRVNHDILMARLARHVQDKRLLKTIRAFLNAGLMTNGVVTKGGQERRKEAH